MNGKPWLTALILLALSGMATPIACAETLPPSKPELERASCETDRVLYPSSHPQRGDDVVELQERLIELGWMRGKPSGVYGKTTVAAVRRLQKSVGMPVNGVTDTDVWYALGEDGNISVGSGAASLPPPKAPHVVVDMEALKLTVVSGGKSYWSFPIAIGKRETPSPVGEFRIIQKSTHWGGGFGTRWMGLNVPWGIYGIHGTNKPWSVGRLASHGCFRMFNSNVEILYRWLPVGTAVDVISRYSRTSPSRPMKKGTSGQDVVELQLALKRLGLEPGRADGRFGEATAKSVLRLHAMYGLPGDGNVGKDTYSVLKLLGPWPAGGGAAR